MKKQIKEYYFYFPYSICEKCNHEQPITKRDEVCDKCGGKLIIQK